MGSWDCYCAICGGPFVGADVSRKPRTARFRRTWAKKAEEQRRATRRPDDVDVSSAPEGEQDDSDTESLDRYDEDHSYDPEVISVEDVRWTGSLHVLGLNPEATGTSRAFVSGPGRYEDYGCVNMQEGSDPGPDGVDWDELNCYHSWDSGDPVFPFHWCCYELLAKCHTGSFDVDKLDKDLLYSIMRELAPDLCSALEEIDYGDASFMQEQFWEASPGYEYIVSHPRNVPGIKELVLSMFGTSQFEVLSSDIDPGVRVKSDPFARLPYDLVYNLSTMLGPGDLLSLSKASWPIHALLRDIRQFWQERLKSSMPWFFELQELLEQDQTLSQGTDPKRIYLWAEKVTRPTRWITGPFMSVANRRRIWSVCEQLGKAYWSRLDAEDSSQSYVEETILKYSKCSSSVTVSAPEAIKTGITRNAYWIESWDEMFLRPKELATFWDGVSLVGISVAPYGVSRGALRQERRLFGRDASSGGIQEHFIRLEESTWITGLVLHIPTLNFGRCRRLRRPGATVEEVGSVATSPQGLTVILNTREKMLFGTTNRGYSQRFLPAAPGWHITGMIGMTGEVDGKQQFTRLGLLQAQHPGLPDDSMLSAATTPPRPTPLQSLLWDDDYVHVLNHDIWSHPTLRLVHVPDHLVKSTEGIHRDLVPHEALIWARDQRDLRSLRRLSGFVVAGGKYSMSGSWAKREYVIHDVCGVNAEYTTESTFMRRMIGINKTSPGSGMKYGSPWMHFEIDGPGGEMITEIQYAMHEMPKAMKIRTNRGRECYWGEIDAHGWQSLTAPPGETLVGLVMAFTEPSVFNDNNKTYAHCKLSFVGALSMPLGIPEESRPVGEWLQGRTRWPVLGRWSQWRADVACFLYLVVKGVFLGIAAGGWQFLRFVAMWIFGRTD